MMIFPFLIALLVAAPAAADPAAWPSQAFKPGGPMSVTVSGGADLQAVYDAMPSTASEPPGFTSEVRSGTIFLNPGWYDVGTGLVLDKAKPVALVGVNPPNQRTITSGFGYFPGAVAHIYSTTGQTCVDVNNTPACPTGTQTGGGVPDGYCDATCLPDALVHIGAGTTSANAYGFHFENLVFESTSSGTRDQVATDYGIWACNINETTVKNNIFFGDTARTDQVGVGVDKYRCLTGGDSSWWNIERNYFYQMAIARFKWGNANRIINNSAYAGEGSAGSMTIPALELQGQSRAYVAYNEIHGDTSSQGWPVGIEFDVGNDGLGRRSQLNTMIGNSGERNVDVFIQLNEADQNVSVMDGLTATNPANKLAELNTDSELNMFYLTHLSTATQEDDGYTSASIEDNTTKQNSMIFSPEITTNAVITVETTDDPDAVANAAPAGATIRFAPGVHYLSTHITAKKNQTYEGVGAILRGAEILTNGVVTWTFSAPDADWSTPFTETSYTPAGAETCHLSATHPNCSEPNDVFYFDQNNEIVDGAVVIPKRHVASRAAIGAGDFFIDEGTNTLYVGDDPTAASVDAIFASKVEQAFYIPPAATGVTIRDLTVQMFASSWAGVNPKPGAIYVGADDTTLEHVTVNWNHAEGVRVGDDAEGLKILHSDLSDNGLAGYIDFRAQRVEIGWSKLNRNNYNMYSSTWVCGGAKVSGVNGIWVHDSDFSGNIGDSKNTPSGEPGCPGLWFDTAAANILVEHNTANGNGGSGFITEVSCNGRFRYNSASGNRGAGFACSTCQTTDFYRNLSKFNTRFVASARVGSLEVDENDARVGEDFDAKGTYSICPSNSSWPGIDEVTFRYNSVIWAEDDPDSTINNETAAKVHNVEAGDVDFIGNCYDTTFNPAAKTGLWRIGNYAGSGTFVDSTFAVWTGAPTNWDDDADARNITTPAALASVTPWACEQRWLGVW